MNESQEYIIEIEGKNILLRISLDIIDEDSLTKLLDYLVLMSIRKRSRLSADKAESLIGEIEGEVWKKVRMRIYGV